MPEVTFIPPTPDLPPRSGRFALWGEDGSGPEEPIELATRAGSQVRRTRVPARLLALETAMHALTQTPAPPSTRSYDVWAAATLAGLGLIARGKLVPARTTSGLGAWRVGPLEHADLALLRELAESMPAPGHAVPVEGSRPLRIRRPDELIRLYWDGLADSLVRTPAAAQACGAEPFAEPAHRALGGPADWVEASANEAVRAEHAGARVLLRIEPTDPDFRAVLQLRSTADPSLIVDVADLWNAPAAVLARLGAEAETDLLLGLRRGARAWPPLGDTLRAQTPTGLDLADPELEDLLANGAEALEDAGIEVLWPTELFGEGLSLKATTTTPTPEGGVDAGLDLQSLLEFRWQPMLDGEPLTDEEVQALADAKRPFVRLRGKWVKVDKEMLAKLRRRRDRRIGAAEALAATLGGELEIDGETVEFAAEGQIADLAALLRGAADTIEPAAPPPGLEATLRPYQQRGLAWLDHLTRAGVGACLADDMGLGKTLQLIALHLHRRPRDLGPTLVICPTTLLGTWQRELARFAPDLPVRRYHGTTRDLDDLAPDEVVLTSYGVVRLDHERLGGIGWGLAVADEAQHAKNPLSRTARAIRAIPAAARVALTGTPVENRLSELWSILDWTTPGLLGSLKGFTRRLAVPVEKYRDPDATARLAAVTRPFILRRKKTDPGIAPELPRKTESEVVTPLTSEQATLYKAVVDDALARIAESEGIERRGLVLKLLTGLKQVCNHPAQYLKESAPITGRSGKLAALDELLDVILDEGESVLVFSQYVEMNRLLEKHLTARGINTGFLHGGVGVGQRERLVGEFQAGGFPVFLLSLKAAGVGLTLTRATHVVHYDRWWNPAVEDQATDRAYRIGQDRPVQVHRLVTEGTLEDRIAALMTAKRELADAVVGSGEAWLSELSDAELGELVTLGGEP